MYKIKKEVRWEAAHRLLNYKGKCHNIHGHSYRAIFAFEKSSVDESGMVVDFTFLKEKIQKYLNDCWDHVLILNDKDPLCSKLCNEFKFFIFDGEPTAENMARYLFDLFYETFRMLDSELALVSVKVFESDTSSAIYCEKGE